MAALIRRGSDSSLPNLWGPSVDSATDEEVDLERRGSNSSAAAATARRGSRLLEFLEKKNKKDRKKYKDKQGFVWRRMIHDNEDLPAPRAPSLGATPWLVSSDGSSSVASTPMPSLAPIVNMERKISMLSNKSEPPPVLPQYEAESCSLTSFKTCPSDPNLTNLVPRQVSDNYKLQSPIPLPVAINARPIAGKPPPYPAQQPQQQQPAAAAAAAAVPAAASTSPRRSSVPPAQRPPDNVIGGVRHLVRDR